VSGARGYDKQYKTLQPRSREKLRAKHSISRIAKLAGLNWGTVKRALDGDPVRNISADVLEQVASK
jgi:hypothetical protein